MTYFVCLLVSVPFREICPEEVHLTWPYRMSREFHRPTMDISGPGIRRSKGEGILASTECNEGKPLGRPQPFILLRE